MNPLLSIIIPFHNAEKNSTRLLDHIRRSNHSDIEFVLVDDGSYDNTLDLLTGLKTESEANVLIFSQENMGPGGARNTGLKAASGKYVWFVDADDDFDDEVISSLRTLSTKSFDIIDFNINSGEKIINTVGVDEGSYSESVAKNILLDCFGRIVTKFFLRKLLVDNNLFFPSFCIYEDTPLTWIVPLYVRSFYKISVVGYLHHTEYTSITRGGLSARYFDRIYTNEWGLSQALERAGVHDKLYPYKETVKCKFVQNYLVTTIGTLSTKLPSKNWILVLRVMRAYRSAARRNELSMSILDKFKGSRGYKYFIWSAWKLSYFMPDQSEWLKRVRLNAWNREF